MGKWAAFGITDAGGAVLLNTKLAQDIVPAGRVKVDFAYRRAPWIRQTLAQGGAPGAEVRCLPELGPGPWREQSDNYRDVYRSEPREGADRRETPPKQVGCGWLVAGKGSGPAPTVRHVVVLVVALSTK